MPKWSLERAIVKNVTLVNRIYEECKILNNNAGYIKWHVDHVVPLAKGGLHCHRNLQLLTARDNLRKGISYAVPEV